MSPGVVVLVGNWQRGNCPMGVIVLRCSCPQGSCPQGSCPRIITHLLFCLLNYFQDKHGI